jgi:hypothetical protein
LSLVLAAIYWVVPIWAVISVARHLRGALRIFWLVIIIGSWFFIPLIGLIWSIMFLAFKKRFIAVQRSVAKR